MGNATDIVKRYHQQLHLALFSCVLWSRRVRTLSLKTDTWPQGHTPNPEVITGNEILQQMWFVFKVLENALAHHAFILLIQVSSSRRTFSSLILLWWFRKCSRGSYPAHVQSFAVSRQLPRVPFCLTCSTFSSFQLVKLVTFRRLLTESYKSEQKFNFVRLFEVIV